MYFRHYLNILATIVLTLGQKVLNMLKICFVGAKTCLGRKGRKCRVRSWKEWAKSIKFKEVKIFQAHDMVILAMLLWVNYPRSLKLPWGIRVEQDCHNVEPILHDVGGKFKETLTFRH